MTQQERADYLIKELLLERGGFCAGDIPKSMDEKRKKVRCLMNLRSARPLSPEIIEIQDEYLREETARKGITDVAALTPVRSGIYLWQGDITTLRVDAIVNAAKSPMTGCITPNHTCIDNCIHTFAGMQLRYECDQIVRNEGLLAPGRARITSAYNLPCDYIIHTVGAKVFGDVTEESISVLRECYNSCLSLAESKSIGSIAFCCIGTGEFRFPNLLAAQIAVNTVLEYKEKTNSNMKVVFTVFQNMDKQIYMNILKA